MASQALWQKPVQGPQMCVYGGGAGTEADGEDFLEEKQGEEVAWACP